MRGDVRRRLEDAGSSPVSGPDPAFVDALEARLHAVAATLPPAQDPATTPEPSPRRRRFRVGWKAAGASLALAAAVLVLLGVGLTGPRPGPGEVPTLAGSVNVQVALADGTILEDPVGLLLPEGAIVTVSDGGSARIGDTTLYPGDIATVRDGRLDVERPPGAVAGTPPGSPGTAPSAVPTRTPLARTPSPSPTGSASPAPGASAEPTAQTGPTGRPVTAAPTATPAPAVLRPRLRARLLAGPRIAVTWTETVRARSYVLVATRSRGGPARDPVYPGSRVIGEFAAPPETPIRFRVPDGVVEMRLMVVALRADGSVIRRSNIVAVTVPVSGDTTGSGSGASPLPITSQEPGPTTSPGVTPAPSRTPDPSPTEGP